MRKWTLFLSLLLMFLTSSVFAAGNSELLNSASTLQDWHHQFLVYLTNPNIAYLLMLLAIYGIFFELANPGMVLPGVVGVISLLLVIYAFKLMPINYIGLLFFLFGISFMMLEVYVSSFGIAGVSGVIAFIIGSIMLFDIHDANNTLSLTLVVAMSIISITFIFIALNLAIKSHKRKIVTGQEGLIGCEGVVLNTTNEKITVRVSGEIWEAKSTNRFNAGDKIKVKNVQGLILMIEPAEKSGEHL